MLPRTPPRQPSHLNNIRWSWHMQGLVSFMPRSKLSIEDVRIRSGSQNTGTDLCTAVDESFGVRETPMKAVPVVCACPRELFMTGRVCDAKTLSNLVWSIPVPRISPTLSSGVLVQFEQYPWEVRQLARVKTGGVTKTIQSSNH